MLTLVYNRGISPLDITNILLTVSLSDLEYEFFYDIVNEPDRPNVINRNVKAINTSSK